MGGDPRVQHLLEEILDSERSPEEVCRDCAELLPQVRDRLKRLRVIEAQVEDLFPEKTAMSSNDARPSGQPPTQLPLIAGYDVQAVLGYGGMGVVYKAWDLRLNRPVAIKMLLAGAYASPDERERFYREAEAAAGLRHPNIVQVYDLGNHDGRPYFTLEFVEGGTLAQQLGGTPQPVRQAATLLVTLAGAVQVAHQGGIIHRDLKPANVLLTADSMPKIADFGLARRLAGGAALTMSGAAVGTPSYMAPERAQGKIRSVGPAIDIYSLWAILYKLLTGRPPFRAETASETEFQVITQEPVPPSRLNARVPRDIETICLKCLEKDPARRYATAGELASDLERFLNDEPIRARPVGMFGRMNRWARRNPVPAGLLSALVLTGLFAFLAIFWQWRQAEALAQSVTAANVQLTEQRSIAVDAQARAEQASKAERWERYRSNIAAAGAALQLENSGMARRALEAAPPELRGWEWHHLHSQLDSARAVMPGAAMASRFLSQRPIISPSGQQLATVNRDERTIDLWDLTTGIAVGILHGHEGPVNTLAYSPDGKGLASGSTDKTIRIWDPATGREVAVLHGHQRTVEWLCYSPDGQRICSLDEKVARLWDTTTGRAIAVLDGHVRRYNAIFTPDSRQLVIGLANVVGLLDATTGRKIAELARHELLVEALAVSPDGTRIASHGEHEKTIRLWDRLTKHEVAALRGHTVPYEALAFSPDGSRLATGCSYPDSTVRLWEAATGRAIAALRGHSNSIISVAFSPDGRSLVSASPDQTARLWDGITGQPIAALRGHSERLWNALFSPDGKRVVTASVDQTLRLWDSTSGDLITVLRGHKSEVRNAVFVAHGSILVSFASDGETRTWDMELAERNGILRGHESFVYDVAFSPDGTQVASSAWDGTARVWDVTTGGQVTLLQHDHGPSEAEIVSSVAWRPTGRQLATVTRADTITLWDATTGIRLQVFTAPTGEWTGDSRAVFNPTGTLLASGSRDGVVRLWDVATGKPDGVLKGHQGSALDAAFSPDGKQLATVGYDRTVRLWDVANRTAVAVLPGGQGYRITYSADGGLLAASSLDGDVRLWDAHTYAELAILPHGNRVYGLAFSPDGSRLATACGDNTIRLWNVASRQEVCELRGHQAYVHAVAFSRDGTRLASASGDFTVRIWDSVPPSLRARPAAAHAPPRD